MKNRKNKNNNAVIVMVIVAVAALSIVLAVLLCGNNEDKNNLEFFSKNVPEEGTPEGQSEGEENDYQPQIPEIDEPVVDEPESNEPSIEEPGEQTSENPEYKIQDPESETPETEEPMTEEPEIEEPETEEPITEEEPEIEEPAVDEPTVEDPVAEIERPEQPEMQEPAVTDVDGDWNLILVNPWNKLPENYTVQLAPIAGGHEVDARIVDDLEEMMSDLSKAGCSAFVCSSYRKHSRQTTLYNNEVADYIAKGYSEEEAAVEAAKWVAIPGTSEHQTGLAVDIMSNHYLKLDKGQEDTAEQKWLMENSWKYGFILRYPNDKSEITGIYYEPWHYRYVGKEAAKEIYEKGICFEEYLAKSN